MALRLTEAEFKALKRGTPPPARRRGGRRWEDMLAFQLTRSRGLQDFEREFKFLKDRRFRFDFAWPSIGLACEIDGGVHGIKRQMRFDREKGNLAVLHQWRVVRVSAAQVRDGSAVALLMRFV